MGGIVIKTYEIWKYYAKEIPIIKILSKLLNQKGQVINNLTFCLHY